jgi:hypothetical protein
MCGKLGRGCLASSSSSSAYPAEFDDGVLLRMNCGIGAVDAMDDRGDPLLLKNELDLDSALMRRAVVRTSDISEGLVRPVPTDDWQLEKIESLYVAFVVVAVDPLLSSLTRG